MIHCGDVTRNNRVGIPESQNRGLLVRRGARPHYFNFHVEGFTSALLIVNDQTCVNAQTATGFELKNSTFALNQTLGGSVPVGCSSTATAFLTGNGNTFPATSSLLSPLSLLVPDFRPSVADVGATPPAGFDVTATYVGAVAPASATKNNAPWYAGWTRGWQSAATP